MQFVLLGPGSFRMGTPPEEQDREPQEVQHSVTLSAFYMSRYEVTQAEWERVTGHNPSQFQDCGARCPVENVNWFEVQQFVRQLNNESQTWFPAADRGGVGVRVPRRHHASLRQQRDALVA